jgi:hypothetical protein
MVRNGTAEFCNLNFDATYSDHYTKDEIIAHAYGYLTALARSKYGSNFFYSKEKETSAFYMCTSDYNSQLRAMRRLDTFVHNSGLSATHAVSFAATTPKTATVCYTALSCHPLWTQSPSPRSSAQP